MLASGLLALGCAPSATQLIVSVDTDLLVPSELDRIEVSVTGPTGTMASQEQMLRDTSTLPLTLSVIPSGEELGPIEIVAIGFRGATEVVRRAAEVTLVRGETRVLPLFLLASCRGVTCPADQTCGEAGCSPRLIPDPPPWTGTPPRIPRDAGPMDAPSDDAPFRDAPGSDAPGADAPGTDAATTDAGPPCTTASDCDDGVSCTLDVCDMALGCSHQPIDMICEDGEPCTTDTCDASGCVHAANSASCDDGTFCNGFDTCGGSTCSVHAGNPCAGATVCDEAGGRCTGCTADTDCPSPSMGAWSMCDYADACDQSAQQTRTVRTFACTAGACVGSDMVQAMPCTRTTTGTSCGSGSCGSYGACSGFVGTCSESGGTQSRTCTDLVCGSGVCGAAMCVENQACTRSTTGTSCGATTCGAFGTCGGFASTCATSGTQSRTCMDFACAGGGCAASPRMDSQSCMRSTTGTTCGTSSCTAWSACAGFATTCSTGGTQTRTCTPLVCASGACGPGTSAGEMQACSRATDGTTCDFDRCSFGTGTCSGGSCSGYSECFSPCICPAGGAPVCRDPGGGICAV